MRRLFTSNTYLSLSALLILFYVLFRVAHFYPKWEKPGSEAVLSWDVYGYYLYLPAIFIHNDLKGLSFKDENFEQYFPAGSFYHATQAENGNFVLRYPVGMALLYLPFFLIGHMAAGLQGLPQDGFSVPYQFWIAMGCIVYACLGLIILRKVLLRFFKDIVVTTVLGVLVLGTNYFNYVAFDGAMTHNALFSFYAVILLLTILWHEEPRLWVAALLGIAIGWATILRPTDLMSVLIPLFWGVKDRESLQQKIQLVLTHWRHILLLGLGTFVMGMIQLTYWKYASGNWFYYSYGEYGFDWLHPHIWDGMFSYKKGWLVYTPVMALSLIGLIPLFRDHRGQFLPIISFLILNLYVVFAWSIWWYGGSFGMRPLVQSYALLALPLGACLTVMFRQKILTIIGIVFILLCIDLNLVMTWQAHSSSGGWHSEYMTKAYYWKIFGSTNNKKADRLFLDVKRELKDLDGMEIRDLYFNDFESDSSSEITTRNVRYGKQAWLLNGGVQFSPSYEVSLADLNVKKGSWIRVQADVFYVQKVWDEWKQAQVSAIFFKSPTHKRENQPWKQTTARVQWLTNPWQWHHLEYEMRIPKEATPETILRFHLWNANSDKEVWVDNMKLELIEPEE
ncbi:MAG: hypothetical protein AAF587_09425 [Bacteroidota bacterium]